MYINSKIKSSIAIFSLCAISIAIFGLLGYLPGFGLLGSIKEDYIPMAPTTAISFIVLAGILLNQFLRSLSESSLRIFVALTMVVTLFAALEVVGYFTGMDLNFEDILVPTAGHLGEIPIGRMSVFTGALFLLSGLAVLALLWRVRANNSGTSLGDLIGALGVITFGTAVAVCLAYLFGSPLLYGQGATIPMALTTALAFIMLGAAIVRASGKGSIPLRWLSFTIGPGTRTGMSEGRRLFSLALVMVLVSLMVMTITIVMLYRSNITEYREQLASTVQIQARLIEAVAQHDPLHDKDVSGASSQATMGHIIDAHAKFARFGTTGEFVLARQTGDEIEFIVRDRFDSTVNQQPVAYDSALAEPMRLALQGLSGSIIGLDYRGDMVIAAYEPVAILNVGLVVKIDLAEIQEPFIKTGLIAVTFALILILGGTALFFHLGRPIITKLREHTQDLEKEITERKQAEEERGKLEHQIKQTQKIESIGQLAGGVAHDFNNMLGVILGHAELAMRKAGPSSPFIPDLEAIRSAANRSADLTRKLLTFARKQTIAPKVLDLNETVAGMLQMLQRLIGENIQLSWNPEISLWPVKVDPSQIDQILANLCVNARDAISGTGKITIKTANSSMDESFCVSHPEVVPGDYVQLSFSDDGKGMDKDVQSHVFEPFYTTKGIGEGTGLGLATVYGAVRQNSGAITLYSEPGHGTVFNIYLPRVITAIDVVPEITAEPLQPGAETVLLVEDDKMLLQLKTSMLEKCGYTVLPALTPGIALSLARQYTSPIHLLLTDVIMPEMNGKELSEKITALRTETRVIFMSGYTADIISRQGVIEAGVHFLQKPVSLEALTSKVREVLDHY